MIPNVFLGYRGHWWPASVFSMMMMMMIVYFTATFKTTRHIKCSLYHCPPQIHLSCNVTYRRVSTNTDVDVDEVNERRPKSLCPYHVITVYKFARITHTQNYSYFKTSAPYKSFTYLLTYLYSDFRFPATVLCRLKVYTMGYLDFARIYPVEL